MKILRPSLLILCCFILGGIAFKLLAPKHCAEILPNDTIFVLTGDARRIPFAMRQLHKYPGVNLYIIGAGAVGSFDTANHVNIEMGSKSTYQNALAIKNIAQEKKLKRIVIITTEDHINRAKYLIRRELPDVEIASCPTSLTDMPAAKRVKRWFVEYVKYIATIVGVRES